MKKMFQVRNAQRDTDLKIVYAGTVGYHRVSLESSQCASSANPTVGMR